MHDAQDIDEIDVLRELAGANSVHLLRVDVVPLSGLTAVNNWIGWREVS